MKRAMLVVMVFSLVLIAAAVLVAGAAEEEAPAAAPSQAAFQVGRLVMATGVADREPVGVASEFPDGPGPVYCFLEATDIREETEALFVWYHEGVERARVSLRLGQGPRWRTWSSKDVTGQPGAWKVEVEDASGAVAGSAEFTVR